MMNLAQHSIREHLSLKLQRLLVEQVREVFAASPPVQPRARGGQPMSVRVTSAGYLGWVGDGDYSYRPTDARGRPWPPIPAEWVEIADRVAGGEHPWDSAILNWYAPGAKLGEHRDLAESDRSWPIVTISLGDAATWTVRDDAGKLHRARLESGDVTLLCVEDGTRLALHSIDRVISAPLLSPLPRPGRASITLRVAGV